MNKQETIENIASVNPRFFIDMVSKNFPFSKRELETYKDYLNWELISQNSSIGFNYDLISQFRDYWFWFELTRNPSVYWHTDLIKENIRYLHRPESYIGNPFSHLSSSNNINWNMEIITEFIEYWDWENFIMINKLPWSNKILKHFQEEWNWKKWRSLLQNGSFLDGEIINLFIKDLKIPIEDFKWIFENKNIKWKEDDFIICVEYCFVENDTQTRFDAFYSINRNLPLSIKIFDKYKDWIHFGDLSHSTNLNWSIELIEKYCEHWDWEQLSSNESINWDKTSINKFYNKLVFSHSDYDDIGLSSNSTVQWDLELLDKYKEQIDFSKLGRNTFIKWDKNILTKYENEINWEDISSNPSIQWDKNTLTKYENKLNWKDISKNPSIQWDENLIDSFAKKIDWKSFTVNPNITWNLKLLSKYENQINWESLYIHDEKLEWYYHNGISTTNRNSELVSSIKFLTEFSSKLNWAEVIFNPNIKWDLSMFKKFSSFIFTKKIEEEFKVEYYFHKVNIIDLESYEYVLSKFKSMKIEPRRYIYYNLFDKYISSSLLGVLIENIDTSKYVKPIREIEAEQAERDYEDGQERMRIEDETHWTDSPHYNDDLDMDEQSPEYWDDIS